MLGEKIRTLRKRRKEKQSHLGEALGVTVKTISKYERNERRPDPETLKKIADYYGVTVDYLLTDTTEITESEKGFLRDIQKMSIDEIVEKYDLVVDNQKITDEELAGMIAWLKLNRRLKNR